MLSRKVLPDVKESIAGLCYVASRCSELLELKILVSQFSLKYGEEYISRVNMLMEHGVKEQVRWIFKLPLYIYLFILDKTSYTVSISDNMVVSIDEN